LRASSQAVKKLAPIFKRERPDLIYLPHAAEWHPDHKACLPIVVATLRESRIVKPELRAYEVWTPLTEYHHVEDITAVMPRKLRALRQHHSQLGEFDYVRGVVGLNQFRGALAAKCPFAEVFQTISLQPGP